MKGAITFFVIAMAVLLSGIYYETHQIKQVLDEKDRMIDSLQHEVFVKEAMLTRYEITLEHLENTNPKVALEFINFMNHETE
jgi:ABC-type thiamine transport system substrate-binding protein